MKTIKPSILALVVSASSALGGCSALTPTTQTSNFDQNVTPVMTEYSNLLTCVGNLVQQSDKPTLLVHVRNIDDETVPFRFRDRRLSKGASWWFYTAINKMQTDKIVAKVSRPSSDDRKKENYLEIYGAWTQDDTEVGVNSKSIGFNNLGSGILDRFGWFDREQTSVIAGDFLSSRQGKVSHASAIALAISQQGSNYEMRIDDGSRRFDFGLQSEANEGPQFAQRRIAEAATLVHIAHAFDIDYRVCVENSEQDQFQQMLKDYQQADKQEQAFKVQTALYDAGFYTGERDGIWGQRSKIAMQQFQLANNLTPTGLHSTHEYAALLAANTHS